MKEFPAPPSASVQMTPKSDTEPWPPCSDISYGDNHSTAMAMVGSLTKKTLYHQGEYIDYMWRCISVN